MNILTLLARRKPAHRPIRPIVPVRILTDWTTMFTQRDWADLPPHHPLRND